MLLVSALSPVYGGRLAGCPAASVRGDETVRVLFVIDCSRSMWERWQSDSKIKVTQAVLLHFLDSVPADGNVQLAMRVFGHLNQNSYGTRLECPFGQGNRYQLQSKIKTLVPNGGATAATALDDALGDFPAADSSRNVIFVVTDGLSGGSNICEVARKLQLSGRVVKTFVLNIASDSLSSSRMECAGTVVPIPTEERFADVLRSLFHSVQAESHVTLQLTDVAGQPFSDDVPVVFYDRQNRKPVYTRIYAGGLAQPFDTVTVDPLIDYDVEVFTRPPVVFRNRTFKPDRTYTLAAAVEQGSLCVRRSEKRVVWPVPDYAVVVRKSGEAGLVAMQSLGDSAKYLAGSYDVEILSTPPIVVNGVEVVKDAVTGLDIPAPGMLILERTKGSRRVTLFQQVDDRLHYVKEFTPNPAGENLILMPGDYLLITKPTGKTSKSAITTTKAKIQSGKQTVAKIDSTNH